MDGLDLLGAQPAAQPRKMPRSRFALAVAAGAIGALLVPKHRVLAFLNVAALTSNAHAVVKRERTWKDAVRRMGRHVVATAGALAMPGGAVMRGVGYVGGAVAADLLIDGEGGGIIEEWERYEGVTSPKDVIDATVVDVQPQTKALVKT